MAHTVGNLVIHLIFSTKERQPQIVPEFRADLFAYLGGIARELRSTALIVNGTTDHVHMLVRLSPCQSVADFARVVKTNSSRWVRTKWTAQFAWQTGYGVFSVSESNVGEVKNYIVNQEEHHKKRSFEEELLMFLKKNNVSYDEKYIWS